MIVAWLMLLCAWRQSLTLTTAVTIIKYPPHWRRENIQHPNEIDNVLLLHVLIRIGVLLWLFLSATIWFSPMFVVFFSLSLSLFSFQPFCTFNCQFNRQMVWFRIGSSIYTLWSFLFFSNHNFFPTYSLFTSFTSVSSTHTRYTYKSSEKTPHRYAKRICSRWHCLMLHTIHFHRNITRMCQRFDWVFFFFMASNCEKMHHNVNKYDFVNVFFFFLDDF